MPDEKEQVQSMSEFPLAIVLPVGARERLELALQEGVYTLRTFLLSNRHPAIPRYKEVNFAFPATWWQAAKEQYFPSWFKRAFPIEMQIVSKRVDYLDGPIYLCPHLHSTPEAKHQQFLATGVKNDSDDKADNR